MLILPPCWHQLQACSRTTPPWPAPLKISAACNDVFLSVLTNVQDLKYFVDAPSKAKSDNQSKENPAKLELLKGITGFSCPGVLTALMGGSGAGKTTLMDVIAGRKTQGEITGDILVNGHPKDQKTWSRVVGYVEQTDIHSPQVGPCSFRFCFVPYSLRCGASCDSPDILA